MDDADSCRWTAAAQDASAVSKSRKKQQSRASWAAQAARLGHWATSCRSVVSHRAQAAVAFAHQLVPPRAERGVESCGSRFMSHRMGDKPRRQAWYLEVARGPAGGHSTQPRTGVNILSDECATELVSRTHCDTCSESLQYSCQLPGIRGHHARTVTRFHDDMQAKESHANLSDSQRHALNTRRKCAGTQAHQTGHPHQPHIVVIGASVAGLTAAHALQRHGCRVTIVEADLDHVGGSVCTRQEGSFRWEQGPTCMSVRPSIIPSTSEVFIPDCTLLYWNAVAT